MLPCCTWPLSVQVLTNCLSWTCCHSTQTSAAFVLVVRHRRLRVVVHILWEGQQQVCERLQVQRILVSLDTRCDEGSTPIEQFETTCRYIPTGFLYIFVAYPLLGLRAREGKSVTTKTKDPANAQSQAKARKTTPGVCMLTIRNTARRGGLRWW